MKMTSAYANKLLKKLSEDKNYWNQREVEGSVYIAALGEDPVIPEYDYESVAKTIAEIDAKMVVIKHAINVNNVMNKVNVGDCEMTIDEILVSMAQLNARKRLYDIMRKREEKRRVSMGLYNAKKLAPEYEYINYDLEVVKKDYEIVDARIAQMQMALDKYNQTFEFEVEV